MLRCARRCTPGTSGLTVARPGYGATTTTQLCAFQKDGVLRNDNSGSWVSKIGMWNGIRPWMVRIKSPQVLDGDFGTSSDRGFATVRDLPDSIGDIARFVEAALWHGCRITGLAPHSTIAYPTEGARIVSVLWQWSQEINPLAGVPARG